jgi:hypothetical protein
MLGARRERKERLSSRGQLGVRVVGERDGERTRLTRALDVLDHVRCLAGLGEPEHGRAAHVELGAVVDGQRDRVAHRGPARLQAERIDAVGRGIVRRAVSDHPDDRGAAVSHRRRYPLVLLTVAEEVEQRCRLRADLRDEL